MVGTGSRRVTHNSECQIARNGSTPPRPALGTLASPTPHNPTHTSDAACLGNASSPGIWTLSHHQPKDAGHFVAPSALDQAPWALAWEDVSPRPHLSRLDLDTPRSSSLSPLGKQRVSARSREESESFDPEMAIASELTWDSVDQGSSPPRPFVPRRRQRNGAGRRQWILAPISLPRPNNIPWAQYPRPGASSPPLRQTLSGLLHHVSGDARIPRRPVSGEWDSAVIKHVRVSHRCTLHAASAPYPMIGPSWGRLRLRRCRPPALHPSRMQLLPPMRDAGDGEGREIPARLRQAQRESVGPAAQALDPAGRPLSSLIQFSARSPVLPGDQRPPSGQFCLPIIPFGGPPFSRTRVLRGGEETCMWSRTRS